MSYLCNEHRYREVIVYKDYFESFLSTLKPEVQRKILQILRIIEIMERVPQSYLKQIENTKGLYELRIVFGGNNFRVFCFFSSGKVIVLLGGFEKKTRKTPKKEIEKALRLMKEYKEDPDNKNR